MKIATTELMTEGQPSRIADRLPAYFRKEGEDLPKSAVQIVLNNQMEPLLAEMLQVFRKRVEAISKIITCRVKVDRARTAPQIIDATGRKKWYIDQEVLAEMPLEGFAEGNVEFFELDYDPTVDELDREYKDRGFRPDPAAAAQAMTDDPAFADDRPVAVQWRDRRNRACFAIFGRGDDERGVYVYWHVRGWSRYYRFAGVRK